MKTVLTIAGSDPTGGAGIQMDLRTFHRFGLYGLSVITAVTVQNLEGVHRVYPLPVDAVEGQLDRILSTLRPAAVKTGMLATGEIVEAVAAQLDAYQVQNLVVDPLLISKNGVPLLDRAAWEFLKLKLIPLAKVITPNIFEASVLSGISIRTVDDMREAARLLFGLGPKSVVIKGGHLKGQPVDILYDGRRFVEFTAPRVKLGTVHGTGCAFSAALAAGLAHGLTLKKSVAGAKRSIVGSIKTSIKIGKGQRLIR